jgi:hypothetical protein
VEFMNVNTFIVVLAFGSGVIALWLTVRFPKLMPWSMARLVVHLVVAFVCVYAVKPGIAMVVGTGVPAAHIVGVFAIAFPALVYNFLVCAWMIKLAQASAGGFRV